MDIRVFGSSLKVAMNEEIPHCSPPPSKSHSIRFLLLASLAKGESQLYNLLVSDDISSAYVCLEEFGVEFLNLSSDETRRSVKVIPPENGIFNYATKKGVLYLDVGNSGTLLYMLCMLCSCIPATFYVKGDSSIKKRPLQPMIEALKELRVNYKIPTSDDEVIVIYGRKIEEELNVKLEGKFSQVLSGLLIAASFFHKKTQISLKTVGEAPYIKMTLSHLKMRGIHCDVNEALTNYTCLFGASIEGFSSIVPNDWSQACFLALASIASCSPLIIENLSVEEEQADSKLVDYLKTLGCLVQTENNEIKIPFTTSLKASHFNLSNTPDSLPYLAALCSLAKGVSVLDGVEICRFKECDRVHAIFLELEKLNVYTIEENDKLTIYGSTNIKSGVRLCTYGDHRIAMSLIAFCLALKKDEYCIIENAECCKISYPTFIQTLCKLGARIEEIKN